MTQQEILQLADEAIKQSLFEHLEPAIIVETDGEPRQVVIPHAFVYKFAELLLKGPDRTNA